MKIRNPVYTDNGCIDLEVQLQDKGEWYEHTASPQADSEPAISIYNLASTMDIKPCPIIELPFIEESQETLRLKLPKVSKKQLRLSLHRNGVTAEVVNSAIENIALASQRGECKIEWEDGDQMDRMNGSLIYILYCCGLNDEQMDIIWDEASHIK